MARPGTVGLVGAVRVTEVLFSPDGRTWERRPAETLGQAHGLSTELTGLGFYLVAPAAEAGDEPSGGGTGLFVVVLALPPLALAAVVLARRRRQPPPPRTRGR